MIKFFRKIRQKLLTENKFSKYFLYAIGEIVLVVIGILIALQINNLNESKKDRIKEIEILHDLAENLDINIRTIENDIDFLYRLDRSSEIILSSIYNSRPYADTLAYHFNFARVPKMDLFLSQTGYEAYKNIGLNILTNKNLKGELLTLFETTYPHTLSDRKMVNGFYPPFENHIVQNFIYTEPRLEPIDYQKILTDHYYISWIRAYKEGRKYLIASEGNLLKETQRVRQLLKEELNKR